MATDLLPADAAKDEVLTAKEYIYCPSSENREYILAEYLRYIAQMNDRHQKQYKSIDPDDLEVLGNIIAANASEYRQVPTQQYQPLSVESTTEQSTKRRLKKSNNADDLINGECKVIGYEVLIQTHVCQDMVKQGQIQYLMLISCRLLIQLASINIA